MAETATAQEQEEKMTYRGNCHCGAFVFEAVRPEIKKVITCNCSICHKKNYAFAMVPDADFKVVKGDVKDLTVYKFGGGDMTHMFCPKCGIAVINTYAPMAGQTAISARAIQGPLDLWKMAKDHHNAKEFKPDYVPPSYDNLAEPARKFSEAEGGGKLYHGSCHCGDVTVALRVAKPYEQDPTVPVTECNCSICQRIGATWAYPNSDQVVIQVAGGESGPRSKDLGAYKIRLGSQLFCRRCGVFVANRLDITSDDEFNALPEELRAFLADKRDWQPVNLRIFPDIDLGAVKKNEADGWSTIKPEYVNP